MRNNSGVRVTKQNLDDVLAAVQALAKSEVLVGFPDSSTDRKEDGEESGITNAALAYIHDNGEPSHNIPARPFMLPGMKRAEPDVEKYMSGALRAAMRGNVVAAEGQMHAAGAAARDAIKATINEGIPPPLSERTLQERARRGRVGADIELRRRAKGQAPLLALATPLIDTGQMRNATNYVIRKRRDRR
jgi:hypothetical protein